MQKSYRNQGLGLLSSFHILILLRLKEISGPVTVNGHSLTLDSPTTRLLPKTLETRSYIKNYKTYCVRNEPRPITTYNLLFS